MKIELSSIKQSPNPIRKTWDEGKMDELRWSLMEEGQVEPIGVHENGTGYVIVWGHRRTEAARRAGWTEIEAVVVPHDEVDNLIQAGIENLAGEDMTVDDKAEWAKKLTEMGLSRAEISRRSTVPETTLSQWLTYQKEKASGIFLKEDSKVSTRDEGFIRTVSIAQVLKDDVEAKKAVIAKVSEDRLSQAQTRAVAEAYRDAPTPEVRQQVLKTPIVSRDTAADILRRSLHRVEMEQGIGFTRDVDERMKEKKERVAFENFDFAVKEFLDSMKLFEQVAQKGHALVKYGKYSPEAAQFAIRRIERLIDTLKNYREELEGVK